MLRNSNNHCRASLGIIKKQQDLRCKPYEDEAATVIRERKNKEAEDAAAAAAASASAAASADGAASIATVAAGDSSHGDPLLLTQKVS